MSGREVSGSGIQPSCGVNINTENNCEYALMWQNNLTLNLEHEVIVFFLFVYSFCMHVGSRGLMVKKARLCWKGCWFKSYIRQTWLKAPNPGLPPRLLV